MLFGTSVQKVEAWTKGKKVDKLVKASTHADQEIRIAAIKGLGTIDDDKAVNALISALRNRDPKTRIAVIEALANTGKAVVVEHIRSLVSDTDQEVSQKAKDTLKSILSKAKY